jgi:RNA polymerase sigma factor (sigma-70 family)
MIDDRTLVGKVLDGDIQAFRILIRQNERLVLHMIGRLVKNTEERDELCQDVFLKVHEKLGEFSFQSKLSTWIATIAYRNAVNHLRKRRMLFTELPDEDSMTRLFVEPDNPESIASEKDMDEFVFRLIDGLPPQYKLILNMYHMEDLSYQEISQITGMPDGTVKNYLFRARNLLKDKVKKYLANDIM